MNRAQVTNIKPIPNDHVWMGTNATGRGKDHLGQGFMPIRKSTKGPAQKNPHESPSLLSLIAPEPPVRWKLTSWCLYATPPSIKTPMMKRATKAIAYHLSLREVGPGMRAGWILRDKTAITASPERNFLTPYEEG